MQIQSSDHRGQPMHDKAWKGLDVRKSCEQNFGRIPRASENTRNGKRWPDFFFFSHLHYPFLLFCSNIARQWINSHGRQKWSYNWWFLPACATQCQQRCTLLPCPCCPSPALPLWAARSLYSSGHMLMTKPAVSITVLLIPLKINRLKIKVLMEFSKPAVPVLQSSPAQNNRRFCYENQLLFQIISILHKPDVPVSSPGMNLLHTQRKICERYFHRGANVALTRVPLPNYSSTCTRRNGEGKRRQDHFISQNEKPSPTVLTLQL